MGQESGAISLFSLGTFVKELISHPREVGAIFPSSQKLARVMASFIPDSLKGFVIELGAGTGAVTAALLERGISPDRIIVIERSAELVRLLKKRFPKLCIIEGDARFLNQLLAQFLEEKDHPVAAVVSSLPLLSLPKNTVQAIEEQLDCLLDQEGRLIQFTYDLRPHSLEFFRQFIKCASKIVWWNLPPARVDVFQQRYITIPPSTVNT